MIFDVADTGLSPAEFSRRLKEKGVLSNGVNQRQMRLVTHYDVTRADCERALAAIAEISRSGSSAAASFL